MRLRFQLKYFVGHYSFSKNWLVSSSKVLVWLQHRSFLVSKHLGITRNIDLLGNILFERKCFNYIGKYRASVFVCPNFNFIHQIFQISLNIIKVKRQRILPCNIVTCKKRCVLYGLLESLKLRSKSCRFSFSHLVIWSYSTHLCVNQRYYINYCSWLKLLFESYYLKY